MAKYHQIVFRKVVQLIFVPVESGFAHFILLLTELCIKPWEEMGLDQASTLSNVTSNQSRV